MAYIRTRNDRVLTWARIAVLCFGYSYSMGCNRPPLPAPMSAPLPSMDEINRIHFSGMLPDGSAIDDGIIVNRLNEVLEALKPNAEVPTPPITLGGQMTFYYKAGASAHIQFIGTGPRNDFLGFQMNGKYYYGGSKIKLLKLLITDMNRHKRDPKLPPLTPQGEP
jgi:hypothetical protein